MADFVKGLFAGQQKVAQPHSGGDDDFADYAGAPDPSPALSSFTSQTGAAAAASPTSTLGQAPYTAWYRVWERTTLDDFKLELYILPIILVIVVVHLWGTRRNRSKATHWIKEHAPVLQNEFAQVGYARPQAGVETPLDPDSLLKERKPDEYATYATGRQNVAFVDFKLTLAKRFNPFLRVGEFFLSLFFESMPAPRERLEATAYAFDGQETKIAPALVKGAGEKVSNSSFDGFVFAVVHKDLMKRMRQDRYDLSLTASKDHAKLPVWVTVMSESAEVTDTILTPELIKAITDAGDDFEALIITDQPMEQPKKLDDTVQSKRIKLSLKLQPTGTPYTATIPLFTYFLRLPDFLAAKAHFRPEAMRRIKATREEQIAKIRKLDDEEKAEERKLAQDKAKKDARDAKLGRMSADEQRKYLDKERERDAKKRTKKQTVKG